MFYSFKLLNKFVFYRLRGVEQFYFYQITIIMLIFEIIKTMVLSTSGVV